MELSYNSFIFTQPIKKTEMKIFKTPKWKTIFSDDVVINRTISWLFFVKITYDSVFKIIVQMSDESVRCFITNGLTIINFDIMRAIKLFPELIPVLFERKIVEYE